MMVSSRRTAPLATISARTFRVTGTIQSLVHNTILHGDKMAVVSIHILFRGPPELTVVNDIIRAILCSERILGNYISFHVIATDTEADITDDEVLRAATIDFVMAYHNTHPRCSLSGESVVLTIDTQVFDQAYLSGYSKADGQGFALVLLHRPTETTFGSAIRIVCQGRNINNFTATTTGGVLAKSFRAGESGEAVGCWLLAISY